MNPLFWRKVKWGEGTGGSGLTPIQRFPWASVLILQDTCALRLQGHRAASESQATFGWSGMGWEGGTFPELAGVL